MSDDIRVLRNTLGEIIISKVIEHPDDSADLILIDPVVVVPQGQGQVALVPMAMWNRPGSGTTFELKANCIMGFFDPEQSQDFIKNYLGMMANIQIAVPNSSVAQFPKR